MYLITNTSLKDSLYVDGIRIASQQSKSFKTIKPLTLAILKHTANARIQLISNLKNLEKTDTNSATVSPISKQKLAKRTDSSVEPINVKDNVAEDTQD